MESASGTPEFRQPVTEKKERHGGARRGHTEIGGSTVTSFPCFYLPAVATPPRCYRPRIDNGKRRDVEVVWHGSTATGGARPAHSTNLRVSCCESNLHNTETQNCSAKQQYYFLTIFVVICVNFKQFGNGVFIALVSVCRYIILYRICTNGFVCFYFFWHFVFGHFVSLCIVEIRVHSTMAFRVNCLELM